MVFRIAFALAVAGLMQISASEGTRWRLDIADETMRPDLPDADSLGGIAWVSNDVYWTVNDSKQQPVVWEMTLPVDRATGKVQGCLLSPLCKPEKIVDAEGLALDPLDGSIWLAGERATAINRYDPATGRKTGSAELPAIMKKHHKDLGLESITISRDGLTMWTCAEAALKPDGPCATRTRGTDVRLTRIVRKTKDDKWEANGQWIYRTDPIAGKVWYNQEGEDATRSGISELCLLDDGTLLVLEREFSVVLVPRFRCRIYETDFAGATDVLGKPSISGPQSPAGVKKRLLLETTGFAMYEGMCLGPALADGSRLMVLISDGDERAFRSVLTIRLSPASGNGDGKCGKICNTKKEKEQ